MQKYFLIFALAFLPLFVSAAEQKLGAYIDELDDSAQPYKYYVSDAAEKVSSPPLLVWLHGYTPFTSILETPNIPKPLCAIADEFGACAVAPFGRGNTDWQTIGERDALRVIDIMIAEHRCDPRRVILVGYSMGGLGAWCIAARHPNRFAALLIISGRADFFTWHKVSGAEIPAWQKRIIDTQFATEHLPRLLDMPILALHSKTDMIVSFDQGLFPVNRLKELGSTNVTLLAFGDVEHNKTAFVGFAADQVKEFLASSVSRRREILPGTNEIFTTGSRIQDAFMAPFAFITTNSSPVEAWRNFARVRPRVLSEDELNFATAITHNLFFFAEPEESEFVELLLKINKVRVNRSMISIGNRSWPRAECGFFAAFPNPFNEKLTAVVQFGHPWGAELSANHKYDRLPDLIVYGKSNSTNEYDFGVPISKGAAFRDDETGEWKWE